MSMFPISGNLGFGGDRMRPLHGGRPDPTSRQYLLANSLLRQGTSTAPVRTPAEALARVAQGALGGYLGNRADEQYEQRERSRAETIARALEASQGAQNLPGPNPDGSAGYNLPPDMSKLASVLSSNPDTASMALPLALQNMQYQQGRQDKLADMDAARADRKEMFGLERQARQEDLAANRDFQRETMAMQQAFQKEMQAFQAAQAQGNMQAAQQHAMNMQRMQQEFTARQNELNRQSQMDIAAVKQQAQPMTEGQSNAATYADRMLAANDIIANLENVGTDLGQKVKAGVPAIGNYLVSSDYQKLDQAKRDYVNAVLRRESGAVISESEFENANKQYFPQPGDSPEVIAQKKKNREIALAGIQRSAGPRYQAPAQGGGAPAVATGIEFLGFE